MIDIEEEDKVVKLTLNNPPVNAICTKLLDELDEKLESLKDSNHRVIIITGEGKSFVAGADISEMKDMNPSEAENFSNKGHRIFSKLENFPKPVIAAVNGFALGGGLEIALSCDIIVASEKALFGQPEVGLGIMPGFGGTQRLTRTVGPKKAKELIFTADRINAKKAYEIGLVNRVVKPDELMNQCKDIANSISKNAPLAVQHAKKAINEGSDIQIDEAMKIEAKEFKECFKTEDHKEGLKAFIEKNEPEFKGK
ncbi:MAG: enoyl-CoA hydratase/isomerase family protein [Thermoplasmatota archaeon]